MYNLYEQSDIQDIVTKEEFKIFFDAIQKLELNLSTRYNALYGIADSVLILLYMIKNGCTAHRACAELAIRFKNVSSVRIPTPQWLLEKLGGVDPEDLEAAGRRLLENTIGSVRNIGKKKRMMIAIDAHLIPFTGTDRYADEWVAGGRPKGGTSWFETYATLQAVSEPQMPTFAVVRIKEDMKKTEFVSKLLLELTKHGVKRRLLLMDREFSNVSVMSFLDKRGEKFLMAVSKTPKIKKAVLEFSRGNRKAISQQTMTSSDGKKFSFWLVIKKRLVEKKGKKTWMYMTFATNIERHVIKRTMMDIPAEYKKRWRIENNYKSVKRIRARTGSRKHAIRTFLFFLSMAACNMWYTLKRKMGEVINSKTGRPAKYIMIDVFIALLVTLAEQIIKSDNKEREYYLMCVK